MFKNNILSFLIAIVAGACFAYPPANATEINGIRFGVTSANETRLVIDLDGDPDYDFQPSPASDTQLTIKLVNSSLSRGVLTAGKGAGQVSAYNVTRDADGILRISVKLINSAKMKQAFVISPNSSNSHHRLVVDLLKAPPGQLASSLPVRHFQDITDVITAVVPDENRRTPNSSYVTSSSGEVVSAQPNGQALQTLQKPVIVIDAGHGGTDPGASGPNGAIESSATLAAALILAETLKESGRYDVVLTRTKDERLAHEERSRIARDAKASLFISLHADAHSDSKVRGGSVYTLSDEGTERSAREALATGNYVVYDLDISETGKELGGILYGLAQRDTANASDKFAELLIGKLGGVTPLLNNTHRRGNFKVLLAPDVPAVLLELAFISNKHDEANLQSPAWRKKTMGAAAAAIDAYFLERTHEKHASASRRQPPAH